MGGAEQLTAGSRLDWLRLLVASTARLLLATCASLLLWCVLPAAIGWQPTTVLTNSMRPRIAAGDIAVVRSVPAGSVQLRQVILFDDPDHPGRLRLHRVVGVDESGRLITRGDANPVNDSTPVPPGTVRGVGTLRIPYVGLPKVWWHERRFWRIGLLSALALLIGRASRLDRTVRARTGEPGGPGKPGAGPPARGNEQIRTPADVRSARRPAAVLRALACSVACCAGGLAWPASAHATYGAVAVNPSNSWSSAPFYKCVNAITDDGPGVYYRLNEVSGTTAVDSSGNGRDGRYRGSVTLGATSPCVRDGGSAVTLDGSTGYLGYATALNVTGSYSLELWFKTTTTSGGRLLGFGLSVTGPSLTVDRQLYLTNAGRVVYGINPLLIKTVTSPATYNNGTWHHVLATQSAAGMRLYVDGALVGSDPATTTLPTYSGFLRAGYDSLLGWPSAPSSYFLAGSVDEVAWYDKALTATDAADHYNAGI